MGVEDRYKKKREESESLSTPYNGVENRYLLKDVKNVSSQITSRLDTWLKNHKNYISNAQNRFSTDGTAYRGGDAANWLAVVTNQNSSFQKEAENLKTLLNNYKDYFDKDYVSSVTKALDDNLDVQKSIVSASAEDLKYWSQFKDEDEYNQFVKESGYLEKYKGMTKEELDEQIAKLQSGSSGSPFENRGKAFVPNEEAKWIQDNYYQLLPYAPDFEEKSRYESTYRGGEKGKHFFSSTGGGYIYTDTGYDDIKYDYINKDPRAIDRQKLNDTETNQIFLGLDFGEVQEMTDEEISIFNYLYSLDTTEDKKEAYKYVEKYLQKDLDERERNKTERLLSLYARENPVSSSIASILFSPLKTISYVGQAIDYIDDGSINENASYNKHSYGNSAIRNEVSLMAANSWGPAGSFLYQTGMSMGDFLFTSLTTGGSSLAALPIMGMSSAADTVIASKDMGLSDNQAFWLGAASGAIEVVTEKIGLDALFDTKALNGGAGKYILKNLLAEGAEEGLSNVGNTVAELIDLALTGDESKIRKEIAIIMQTEGLSESEAIGRYAGGKLQELGLDMLGGAISGGVLGAAGTGVNKMANAEEYKGMADHAQEYVTEALEIDPNNAYAQKLQKKLASGKTLSGSQLVKLVQQKEDTINSNDVAKIKTATANRLTELGETGNVEAIAAALTKYVQGETLTRAERTEIETSDFGQRVANELNPDNIKSGEYSSAWAEKIGTGRINAEEYSRILDNLESESTADSTTTAKEPLTAPKTSTTEISSAVETPQTIEATAQNPTEITQESAPQAKTVAETKSVSAKETATEGKNSASTGADKGSATIKTGGKDVSVKVTDISSVNNGAIMLRLDNGETVNANEVNFSNEDVGIIYQAAADMSTSAGGFNADTVRVFAKGFDPSSGLTAAEYFHGFRNSYRYGAEGAPISVLTKDVYASKLSEELRNKAYHFGRAFGNEKAEQAQAKLESKKKSKVSDDKTKRKAKKEDHRAVTATNKETKTESPKTSYYDGDRAALTDRQRASVEFLEQVFGDRGIKFIFFASYTDENGRRVYKNGDGKVVPAPNGYINPDGSIMIDLNAGQGGEGLILNTASHELTHFIKDWSPTKYRTFAQFLLEQYLDKNVPIERYVQRKIDRAKENGRTIDRKVAYEEVVADSCEMMLVDIINNKNTENLQKLIVKDKSIFDKIKEFFTDLLERIKAVYKGVEPQTTEGAYIREMRDVADKLQTMWTDALVDATDTYKAIIPAEKTPSNENLETLDSGVLYSLRGTNKDGIEVYETSEQIKKLSYKERQKVFLDIMKNEYRGRTAKFVRNGHAYYALFEETDVRKNVYGDKNSDEKGIKAKINVGADGDIFELVESAKYNGSKPESGKTIISHRDVEYWDYFVKTVQIDNKVFDLVANIRKKPNNSFVYDIQLKENKKIKASPPRSSLLRALSGVPNASVNSISLNGKNVNSNFLETDTYENSLADEQAEAFQNEPQVHGSDIRYADRNFSDEFTADILNNLKITKLNDYIHVQKQVFNTLLEEGFFINAETRSRTDANEESGMVIETNKSSISETFNQANFARLGKFKKIAKLATVRALPEIIKKGTLISDNVPNQYQNSTNKSFAYIAYDTVIDGVPITVKLDIKKSPSKNKLWVHSIVTEKNSTGLDVSSENGRGTPYRTDAIGGTISQNNENVNSKSLGSEDIRYSDREDFNELKRKLKEEYGVDTAEVLALSDEYLKNYGGVLNKTQFRMQFLDIVHEAVKFKNDQDGDVFNRLNEMVLDTATEIANNPAISGDLVDELRNIKRHIKDTRIKIPSVQKGDFDIFGGFEAFRRKHFNRLTLTKDGLDVDSVYPELQELFGYSWFPDNIDTVPDQLIRIAEVADMPLGEVTEIHYDSNDVAIDVAADILGKVKKIAIKASKNMARINYRNSDNISPRALLANALESVAQNDIEKNKLKSYRKKIAELNAEEQRLYEIQGRIKELSFASGPRDVAKIKSLRDEAAKSANRISVYDQQLLGLEASKPLKNVLQREKQKAYKKAAEEGRETLEKHKEQAVKTQEELKKRYQESRKRSAENRRMTEMRHKIKKVVSELNDLLIHESKNRNIKPGLQKAVASALESIDVDTIRADERIAKYNALVAKYNEFIEQTTDEDVIASLSQARDNLQRSSDALGEKLEAMRKAYRNIREKDGTEYPDYYKEESKLIESRIEAVVDIVGNTPLRNMSYRQLDAVYDLYKMVLTTVRNANKVFKQGKLEELQENVDLVMTELSGRSKLPEERSAVRDVLRGYVLNELIPYYAFRKIGSKTFESFYWEAIKGQDVYARDIDDARDFASKTREKHHYSTWDFDKIHEFKLADGRTFSVSLKHMMSIYAYAKRNQARLHMQKGGFFFNDKETFRKKGGVLKMIRDSESSYKIDNDALSAIISTMTEEQRQYVDDMQAYMTKMGEKGNEVSQVLWGIDLFKEKIYFPLKSSKDFIYQSNQPVQESSLKNDGMTKETKPGASNPIVLEAFDDVWASHVNRMSQYHAFVLPIENLNKVINYGTWANNDAVSISTMLRSRYGSAVNDYLGQFIKDLNGVRNSQGATMSFLSGMFTKFKKNAVAFSSSVVIQQPTAILRAQALIDAKYFAHLPNTEKLSTRWAEVKKYAPIAIIKEIGGFDAGAGRQTTDWLNADTQKGLKKVSNAIDEATMWGAAKADEIGWCAIWEAVKRETLAKNKTLAPTSEEFLNLVGERFTEIIVKTQVYDSTLSRSGYMRSKNELVKMMTSFMGEPTVSANMLYDSVIQAKRGNISKKTAARRIGAVYLATLSALLAKSLMYALRDEDEDESYVEKYFQALGGSILDDINPLKWIPGVKDVLSIFDGWEVERTDMALFQDLKNAFDALNSDSKSTWRKTEDLAGAFAAIFSLPLKNVMRTAREVYNGFENMTDGITGGNIGKAFLEGITGKEASKSKSLYDAVVAGDKERLEVYRDDYKDEDAYNAALSKALRENDPRVKEAAQARQNGDVAKYTSIAKEIVGEGKFSQDNIVAAINSELRALKKVSEADNGETEKQTDADKAESIYLIDDFYMAIRGGDIATAYAVREDIVNVAIENGESREEAEKDFESNLTRYVQKQYNDAVIGDKEATDMLTTYGSKTETEAASKIRYWAFGLEYPEYEDLSESAINKYYDGSYKDGELYGKSAESYGISLDIYAEYIRGKTGLTQKEDIMYIINTLPLTSRQKDALYYLNNWAKSTIKEAPWR